MVNGRRDCAEDCTATRLEVPNRANIKDLRTSDFCMEGSSFRTRARSVRGQPLLPRQNPHETVEETRIEEKKRGAPWMLILLLLIVAAIIGWWLWSNRTSGSDTTGTPSGA